MFLKRIALHGFKSFVDRTEFEFGPGVTAIVGPNGCGKSNVLDAVRWVLGEQSARSLRGERMSDVVFSGARTRKPANFAEVQLTFDNRLRLLASDQAEVIVARVLYRNGDSEYRLNGNPCRLRDIRELLLDTGVGVDAYSVIEQGRVDLLLQASPIERREIFEEAAGISRYKVRRTEAERKLERTQQNLLRLNDVVDELEKRLRSVKLAAGKARSFQQYDARLRELRAAFALAEYHEFEQQRLAAQQQLDALTRDALARRADLAAREADAAETEHAAQAVDERTHAAEAAVLALQSEASTLSERIAQSQRRIAELAALRERRQVQAGQLAAQASEISARLRTEEAGLAEAAAALATESTGADALRAQQAHAAARVGELRQQLNDARAHAFDAARRAALLQNEQANLEQQRQAQIGRLHALNTRLDALVQEREDLAARRAALADRLSDDEVRGGELAAELRNIDALTAATQHELAAADAAIVLARERRTALLSRLNVLEEMERRFEGIDRGARAVLAWRDGSDASLVAGLVADCLRIDDPRVAALEAVLAGFENHLVVRDSYAFLAEMQRRGQAADPLRIFALDRVPATVDRGEYAAAPGVLARAADWVNCEDAFRPLAESLLGRVYLVDNVERALALASAAPDGFVFVAPAGETVSAGGRLTFGRPEESHGLISRKAEIRQLRLDLDDAETALEQALRRRAELDAQRGDLDLRRGGQLEQLAAQQRQLAELRTEIMRSDDENGRHEREWHALLAERGATERNVAALADRLRTLLAESTAVQQDVHAFERGVADLEAAAQAAEAVAAGASRELTGRLVEVARAAERRTAAENALQTLRQNLASAGREQAHAVQEAESAAAQIGETESALDAARERCAAATAECGIRRSEAAALRHERQALRARLDTCAGEIRGLHAAITQLDADAAEHSATLRELAVRREGLVTRVRDELALDLAGLYADYLHADQDWTAIRTEIDELRQKIARLGHVNLDAIAELDELTPRFENLVAQRSDLSDSIERLRGLIAELDAESRLRFGQTFVQVREQFQELFRKLFAGGKADIILEDPENPLTCGIDIIARPPGKEPQSISLLSGGEKTLTAVALLLAVFKSKPSPFCILDEVDAALDEANVERFNTVVQEFLSQSQFVVITHHKRTMQCADVLYGVTMEEPGVSKRMSVRFEGRVETPVTA